MNNHSKILWEAYESFLLPLGNKKVPTPYRINETGAFQKTRPEFQGKSSPKVLEEITRKFAKEKKINLEKASVEEIRNFMRKNKLGIDCSGFVYRILNHLIQEIKGKSLIDFGFPHVGRANVAKLTSTEFSKPVKNLKQAKSADLIKCANNSGSLHVLLVLENKDGEITYAHSSKGNNLTGIKREKISVNKLPTGFLEIRRLKILS